jgi:hypothetical protein
MGLVVAGSAKRDKREDRRTVFKPRILTSARLAHRRNAIAMADRPVIRT